MHRDTARGSLCFCGQDGAFCSSPTPASNLPTFGLSLAYENLTEGLRSLAKIAALRL